MKRYGYIFEKIYEPENMIIAHEKARRGKAHYSEVQMVNENPELLMDICNTIKNGEYQTSKYDIYEINDRGKARTIFKLPYYPDRIVQWAIMLQTQDIFMKSFIRDTYASIPGRGIHHAVNRVNRIIRHGGDYCLKLDIKKYFPSINQDILCSQLAKKFKDSRLLSMIFEIIKSVPSGLPIGNFLSQWLANFHLAWFDHDVSNETQLPYFRYMDDVVIISDSKTKLQKSMDLCRKLLSKLQLTIKGNHQIFPSKVRGIDFLGYRCFGDFVLLRKRIAENIKARARQIQQKIAPTVKDIASMMSYKGWLDYCNSYRFCSKYFSEVLHASTIRHTANTIQNSNQ
jgi:RNA-directed DNA polymerase